jgi:hypothetical protein
MRLEKAAWLLPYGRWQRKAKAPSLLRQRAEISFAGARMTIAQGKGDKQARQAARLAAALRTNLARRKQKLQPAPDTTQAESGYQRRKDPLARPPGKSGKQDR